MTTWVFLGSIQCDGTCKRSEGALPMGGVAKAGLAVWNKHPQAAPGLNERASSYRADEICLEPGHWKLFKDSLGSELGKVLTTQHSVSAITSHPSVMSCLGALGSLKRLRFLIQINVKLMNGPRPGSSGPRKVGLPRSPVPSPSASASAWLVGTSPSNEHKSNPCREGREGKSSP